MKNKAITNDMIEAFKRYLCENEKSKSTVEKYIRDLHHFRAFINGNEINKSLTLEYKSELMKTYALTSANSMLSSVNTFLRFVGWRELCVRQFRIQKKVYCSEDKELTKAEYISLVKTAEKTKNQRLSLVLQTICGTGIRVSELEYITVEAVEKGETTVSCKGKTRTVFIVTALRKKLLRYAKLAGVRSGAVFVTAGGKPLNRSNVWREMKALCVQAGVAPGKVFPHNLRHLFARTFYGIEKDIAKLADILGHTNINTTRVYIVSTGAEHRRRMENMHLIS